MNDDWRLQVGLHEEGYARGAERAPRCAHSSMICSEAFHDRGHRHPRRSRGVPHSGTREQAESAREAIEADARQHRWTVDVDFRHWHPIAEEWEVPDKPLHRGMPRASPSAKEPMARERKETE